MKLNLKSQTVAGVVAGAAFVASAGHIVSVVDETNPIWFALTYPIGIDGLIYVGIRATQTGRKLAGLTVLLIGAIYSLAFNAHAEDALEMPKLMIASSMPVCMFAAFLIESLGQKVEEVKPVTKTVTAYPQLLPIAPFSTTRVVPAEKPRPRPVVTEKVDAPRATRGRTVSWDVEKAVSLIMDGRTDADVMATVDGLTAKPLQRTKRAIRLLTDDPSVTDESVSETVGQSAAHIARIRAAMKG